MNPLIFLSSVLILCTKGAFGQDLNIAAAVSPNNIDDAANVVAEQPQIPNGQLSVSPANIVGFDKVSMALQDLGSSFVPAFIASFSLIVCSELGDKTFFIAAILSMKKGTRVVFTGAFSALILMTIISTFAGMTLPALINKKYTQLASCFLFLIFAAKLLIEGMMMPKNPTPDSGNELEEIEKTYGEKEESETEMTVGKRNFELEQQQHDRRESLHKSNSSQSSDLSTAATATATTIENNNILGSPQAVDDDEEEDRAETSVMVPATTTTRDIVIQTNGSSSSASSSSSSSSSSPIKSIIYRLPIYIKWRCSRLLSPAFVEAFSLTFTAEWGDRSQVATVALASSKDALGVNLGAIVGHCLCTGLAVMGGKLLASRISEKLVTLSGGFLFLAFAILGFAFGI